MALSNNLIDKFVNAVGVDNKDKLKKDGPLYGTIVGQGGSMYVKLDGSEVLTPIITTVEYAEGERVLVNILKHTATVVGNVSSPAVNGGTVKKVEDKVDVVVADNAIIRDKITASEADIANIKADNVSINGKLDATDAEIKNLKATIITADQADLKYATIENLNVVNETVRNLQGDYGSFKELTTSKITAVEGNITNLTSENVTITSRLDANEASINTLEATTAKITDLDAVNAHIKSLTANKADIDLANVNNAWIQNGIIKDGSIGEAAIHEGAITNAKIADATIEAAKIKSINADTITAGTIKTDRLIITGPDGQDSIVKAINIANGVSEADVNSQKIQAASIDVVDLSAFQAKIAGFDMNGNAIYSGKESIKDPNSGIYISTTGIGMGDGLLTGKDESPLQAYADGSFKLIGKNSSFDFNTVTGELNIEASSLKISSKSVATKTDVDEVRDEITALNIGGRNLLIDSSFNNGYQSYVDDTYQINNNHTLKLYVNNTDTSGTKYAGITESYDNKRLSVPIADCLNKNLVLSAWLYIPESGSVSGYEFRVMRIVNGITKWGDHNTDYPRNLPSPDNLSVGWNHLYATYTISGDSTDLYVEINVSAKAGKSSLAYLSSPKLEFGTRPTDWTPAPEDVDTRIDNAYTEIESNKTAISLKASQTETSIISDKLNTYIDSSTEMIQNANSWQFNFNKLIKTDEADVENHQDYITFQNGDIILGESKSDLKLKIANDSIQFKGTTETEITPDNDTTAWITGKQFNINRGEIHEYLRVGNLVLMPKENGNFTIDII